MAGRDSTSGVRLGNNVSFNFGCFLNGSGGITIGDNTIIASYVCIHSANHRFNAEQVWRDRWNYEPVHIGANCWVGMNANILAGVTIGNNCIIGANAVVAKDIPENSVAYGNPIQINPRADEEECNYR